MQPELNNTTALVRPRYTTRTGINRVTPIRVTLKQQLQIQHKLQEVLVSRGDHLFEYVDDWTDEKISAGMDFPCTKSCVVHVRRELFGDLSRSSAEPKVPGSNKQKLLDLEARVVAIEKILAELGEI